MVSSTSLAPFAVLIFILGAVFGSFLNVVIFRIPKHESIAFPLSHCMKCGHPLHIRDLIPIMSWLSLRGRCRYCQRPISIQYPLIEFFTAVSFLTVFLIFQFKIETILLCAITLCFISLAVIDMKVQLLPNKIQMVLLLIALLTAFLNIRIPIFFYSSRDVLDPVYGAAIGGGILLIVALLGWLVYRKKEVMGMGDVKLLFIIGIICGFKNTLLLLGCAIVIAAAAGIVMLAFGMKGRKDTLAFGPFIILSFYLIVVLPQAIEILK